MRSARQRCFALLVVCAALLACTASLSGGREVDERARQEQVNGVGTTALVAAGVPTRSLLGTDLPLLIVGLVALAATAGHRTIRDRHRSLVFRSSALRRWRARLTGAPPHLTIAT